jgi:hypothetical protein
MEPPNFKQRLFLGQLARREDGRQHQVICVEARQRKESGKNSKKEVRVPTFGSSKGKMGA